MGTDKLSFAEVVRGGATGSHVTGSDVSHRNRKYVLRIRNWKWRNIRRRRAPGNDVSHVTSHVTGSGPNRKWLGTGSVRIHMRN